MTTGDPRAPGPADGAPPAAAPTEVVERYLESIYYMAHEGETVRPSRLAEWVGVSGPTVSVSLQRLARDGWITIAGDRSVSLTREGERLAAQTVRRHRLLERWLTDVLHFDWTTADREAGRLAHGLSAVVLEELDAHLGRPDTCPHGNTIPGRPEPDRILVALADLEPHLPARVVRISEVAEHDAPQLLHLLESHGLVPGARVEVEETEAAAGALALRIGDRRIALETARARAIWVSVETDDTAPGPTLEVPGTPV